MFESRTAESFEAVCDLGVSQIRILTVVRHGVGGIRTYLKYIYGSLPPDKYLFTLLVVEEPRARHLFSDVPAAHFQLRGVPPKQPMASLLRAVISALKTERYDLIHSHGFTAAVVVALANLFFRVPHMVTSHDILRAEQFRAPFGWAKALVLTQLLGRADVIQSVSHDAHANLHAYLPRLRRSRSVVILHGIDVSRFNNPRIDERSWRAELDVQEKAFLFGFLGRIMPEKGFPDLVKAVGILAHDANCPQFCVVVAGEGGYIREQQASIAAQGLSPYFRFAGFLPDVSGILRQLDSVVMPSVREACGLGAMETLVAGCPLIASSCIGLREIIQNTPAVRVRPSDPSMLADTMKYLMHHHFEVKRATLEFVPVAKERYTASRASNALDRLVETTLARRGVAKSGNVSR